VYAQDAYVRHQKDMDALQFRLNKLQQEFESQLNVCDQLNTENQNRALDLKVVSCVIHGDTKHWTFESVVTWQRVSYVVQ